MGLGIHSCQCPAESLGGARDPREGLQTDQAKKRQKTLHLALGKDSKPQPATLEKVVQVMKISAGTGHRVPSGE